MKFIELAKLRYSSRHYLNKEVEKDKLISILDAGRIAPSAANRQPWYFIVVQEKEKRELLAKTYNRDWFKEAPVIIVACGDHKQVWVRQHDAKDHCDIDISIAVDHMTLAATDLGLASCWICAFNPYLCSEILALPEHVEPIAMLSLGYPADNVDIHRHERLRKNFDEVVFWEKFGQK